MKRYSEERNKPRRYANNLPIGKLDRSPVLFYSHYRNNRDNCGICYGATNNVTIRSDIFVQKRGRIFRYKRMLLDDIKSKYENNEYASMVNVREDISYIKYASVTDICSLA